MWTNNLTSGSRKYTHSIQKLHIEAWLFDIWFNTMKKESFTKLGVSFPTMVGAYETFSKKKKTPNK